MKTNPRVLHPVALLLLLPMLLTTVQAKPTVSIAQPEPDEILYGKTRVVVEVSDAPRVDRVLVYIDLYPHAQLESDAPRARYEAATKLFHDVGPEALRSLSRAARREPDPRIRKVAMAGVANITAHLLVHGTEEDQEKALDAIDRLFELEEAPVARLAPALQVYGKSDRPKRMARRAGTYLARLEPSSGEPGGE
jgi:hypothetical protein